MAQRGQKPRVEQKGKSHLDPDFQYEYGPRKRGLSILFDLRSLKQEVSEKLPQGYLACGSQAFIATLLFVPSMSALPIIAKQNSQSVGLFTH